MVTVPYAAALYLLYFHEGGQPEPAGILELMHAHRELAKAGINPFDRAALVAVAVTLNNHNNEKDSSAMKTQKTATTTKTTTTKRAAAAEVTQPTVTKTADIRAVVAQNNKRISAAMRKAGVTPPKAGESTPVSAEQLATINGALKLAQPTGKKTAAAKAARTAKPVPATKAAEKPAAPKPGVAAMRMEKAAAKKAATKTAKPANGKKAAVETAVCSKCGRDNGRPTEQADCRNAEACARRRKAAKQNGKETGK